MHVNPRFYNFQVSSCLTGEWLTEGKELDTFSIYTLEQMDFDSPIHEMKYDKLDDKQFRVKKSNSSRCPNLRISQPYHKKKNFKEFFVCVIENYKKKTITYYLLIDENGNVINWCRNKVEKVMVY